MNNLNLITIFGIALYFTIWIYAYLICLAVAIICLIIVLVKKWLKKSEQKEYELRHAEVNRQVDELYIHKDKR